MRALRFVLIAGFCVFGLAARADDLPGKLEEFQRLLKPGGGSYAEISAFMMQNPDWPLRSELAARREEALADVTNPTILLGACTSIEPQRATTLARCAAAEAGSPRGVHDAGEAWARGFYDPKQARQFLAQFGGMITADAEWERYKRLLSINTRLAQKQLLRLRPAQRRLAAVLLAFRRHDPDAVQQAQALPVAEQSDPTVFLDWVWNRLDNDDDKGALALWQSLGRVAQHAPTARESAFWNARSETARELVVDHDAADAYLLAANAQVTNTGRVLDDEFLTGWIALRQLNQPAKAIPYFAALLQRSPALITVSRAHYWLGRAYAAAGNNAMARQQYRAAAQYPYSYYGQLALLSLGASDAVLAKRIDAAHDPVVDIARANALAGTEMARAAQILVDQDNGELARYFIQRLAASMTDPTEKLAAAYLANTLGMPDQALALARQAATQGVLFPDLGWPAPYTPPAMDGLDPALPLAIARQESNFNPYAKSPVGALGLMQIMPATGRQLARKMGIRHWRVSSLTLDPELNLEMGSYYLRDLMQQYGGTVAYAAASYNAGTDRVNAWRQKYGDPAAGAGDMIDWIEQIPFNETRNYVQRVIENLVIYRARAGRVEPHPLEPWVKRPETVAGG